MRIAVGSVKGSPGATTLALGLAAVWPTPAVLVECDSDGGDLWSRFGHHPDPGLSTLAAASRPGGTARLADHVQRLRLGVDVVLAPPGDAAGASVAALAAAGGPPPAGAGQKPALVLDVGRLTRRSAGLQLAAATDHLLLVTRPRLDELAQVQAQLEWLRPAAHGRLWLVLTGPGAYTAKDVSLDLGVPVAGLLPRSRWGAAVLSGKSTHPAWRRLELLRAITGIATVLADRPEPAHRPTAAARARVDTAEVTP